MEEKTIPRKCQRGKALRKEDLLIPGTGGAFPDAVSHTGCNMIPSQNRQGCSVTGGQQDGNRWARLALSTKDRKLIEIRPCPSARPRPRVGQTSLPSKAALG